MFDFSCVSCQRRQVLFPSQIQQIINDEHGIVMIVRCWCGELGAIRTGAKAQTISPESLELAC